MKKNIFKTKAFPAAALATACIGILAACFLFGREEKPDFQPEEPVPGSIAQEWQETPSPTAPVETRATPATTGNSTSPAGSTAAREQKPDDILEAYPMVTGETDQLVTIDFTPETEALQPERTPPTRNSLPPIPWRNWSRNPLPRPHSPIPRLPEPQVKTEPYMTPYSAG